MTDGERRVFAKKYLHKLVDSKIASNSAAAFKG
jgi:hypothetical protein